MIDNYEQLSDGTIKQIHRKPFNYDYAYSDHYNTLEYAKNSLHLSYLRYAYIIGAIQKTKINSILDVGYGNGDFLKIASNQIEYCYGYDISDYPTPENCTKVDSIFTKQVDIITFFDSLEHFEDISFVKNLQCNYICVSVPECHYFSDEWFENWKHRRPDEHLWHFNLTSITNFFDEMGFDLLNYSNIEDIIRKPTSLYPNILTVIAEKN